VGLSANVGGLEAGGMNEPRLLPRKRYPAGRVARACWSRRTAAPIRRTS